ncbi:hypothetical protein AAFF_G00439320 [Aldrovandia affinis]|uniref:HERV-H LTR-associating protein 1 n=1 Tax=Aldrovandia affinis TaxID=143900 RepID=A0AAD7S7T0_9TELE|nr:hypothetical protein AAFF_G00439320 [Aldrovandia affinis]
MADFRESRNHHWLCFKACAAAIVLIAFYHTALRDNYLTSMEKRELLVSTGSQHLFSLLSVTSHSSLALHKLTLLVYNISNFRNFEANIFPMRYCYCVNNKTNDLTDFTAILLDVMGNSTSYLQEIFKSSSILSVSQTNNSECIYICVMAGKTDRDLSQLWEMESIKPLFNQTITGDVHKGNTSESPVVPVTTTTTLATTTRMATQAPFKERPGLGCPWKRPELLHMGGENEEPTSVISTTTTTTTTVSSQKLQPCLLELCKFFTQCLCRTYTKTRTKRYCVDTHPWYLKYTSEICRRVKRIAFSKTFSLLDWFRMKNSIPCRKQLHLVDTLRCAVSILHCQQSLTAQGS